MLLDKSSKLVVKKNCWTCRSKCMSGFCIKMNMTILNGDMVKEFCDLWDIDPAHARGEHREYILHEMNRDLLKSELRILKNDLDIQRDRFNDSVQHLYKRMAEIQGVLSFSEPVIMSLIEDGNIYPGGIV